MYREELTDGAELVPTEVNGLHSVVGTLRPSAPFSPSVIDDPPHRNLRVLIACEFSGIVRNAFAARGHDAWSCDLLKSELPGNHIQDNVLNHLDDRWDLMIAHPPYTYLTRASANLWWKRRPQQVAAYNFVLALAHAHIPRIAIENPPGYLSTHWRAPDQIINPWMFGHPEWKQTGLWLKNLPPLFATTVYALRQHTLANLGESKDRWMKRSRTFPGIAAAMAAQWGSYDAS